ncbi:MAG: glycosyltransferase, partial [Calditrichaeota bacterium]
RELVRRALFTVVTSEWHDNSPLVIYEALALGKPVIGAKMGGIPELIEDGVDGYIYERGDVKTFVDRVQSLVDHRELAIAMGNKGRLKAEKLYDFEHHYEQLMKLYDFTQKTYASGK